MSAMTTIVNQHTRELDISTHDKIPTSEIRRLTVRPGTGKSLGLVCKTLSSVLIKIASIHISTNIKILIFTGKDDEKVLKL